VTAPLHPTIAELATLCGVQTSFTGADGRVQHAEQGVVLAVLRALGTPVDSAAKAAEALAEHQRTLALRHLEPVLVHRAGRVGSTDPTTVTLPRGIDPRQVWCTLELEDGPVRRDRLTSNLLSMTAGAEVTGLEGNRYRFRLEPEGTEPIPPGYHRLIVEWPGSRVSALLVAAPLCPAPSRGWGVFLPVHALRSERDWGIGSYTDLAELGEWVTELGATMVGSLPLYPAFLEAPADPSPYLPVSRLAYNDVFIDPTVLPELGQAPAARRVMESTEFRRSLAAARAAELVDYEMVARLRRDVLAPMAEALQSGPSVRRDAFCAFVDDHPELLAYARFRATVDRLGDHRAPGVQAHRGGSEPEPTLGYHLYVQWVAATQLAAAAGATPLYADLPVGTHPEGFDPFWAPHSFVRDAHGGAPPDLFFSLGQDWAFPPLHPERIREDGYDYFISVLRRAFGHASFLRVDHIMGLERLYFIPEGFDARHGAYVSYRADELYAVVALEAYRTGAVVVGEDLGTVPEGMRSRMAEHRMLRSWVLEFESTPEDPLPAAPSGVLASWGTHDLPRFRAYLAGDDIAEREQAGQLTADEAVAERSGRALWRRALLRAAGLPEEESAMTVATDGESVAPDARYGEGGGGADLTDRALRACLVHLAGSAADLVLLDLEDLWGETEPQNRPGTGTEAANWRRRAARTLEEARQDKDTDGFLHEIDARRAAPFRSPARVGARR
jgi:4-alpha-glucanotransferase